MPSNEVDCYKIVLSTCKSGEYYGKEAQKTLNRLAQNIHEETAKRIQHFSKMGLIVTFYDFFDKVCYMTIDGTPWIKEEESMLKAFLRAPSTGRYLLETSLCFGGIHENETLTEKVKTELLTAGYTFTNLCNISNLFFYGNYENGLKIGADGSIDEIITDKAQKVMDDYFEKMRIRKKTIINKNPEESTGENYFYDQAKKYNEVFSKKYNVDLSSLITLALAMYKLRKERCSVVAISRKDLLKNLKKECHSDLEKELKLFEISQNYLMQDWRYFKLYKVPVSVVRRPIINLSGKIGGNGLVIYGGHAMLQAMSFLLNDIEAGEIELDLDADAIQEKRGHDFEKKVISELAKFGLMVKHMSNTPAQIGDIDAIAYNPASFEILVIEAKSPRINIDVSKINKQVENSSKWYKQLKRKVDWAKDNLDLVREFLNIEKGQTIRIKGILLTEVPWFYETHPEFRMFTLEELKLLLKNKSVF